jgi:hypothetical protein
LRPIRLCSRLHSWCRSFVQLPSQTGNSALGTSVLQNTPGHRRLRPRSRRHRYEPIGLYRMAERAKARGVDLMAAEGPWKHGQRALREPGGNGLSMIPVVINGQAEVMVDTIEHAAEVAGLLNWSGVEELEPDIDLRPPPEATQHLMAG